ncbi:MAG: hypothetical protein ACRDSE_06735 [Pseudonocardiaceae bacterium]
MSTEQGRRFPSLPPRPDPHTGDTRRAWGVLSLGEVRGLEFPDDAKEVDVASMTDRQVREIMSYETRELLGVIKFPSDATPDQFRKKFPKLTEEFLPPSIRGARSSHFPR